MSSRVTRVNTREELLGALGPVVPGSDAVILLGGADLMPAADAARVDGLLRAFVEHVDRSGTAVVDGGTDSGVMRLVGDLRDEARATFRLVGVLPRGALLRTSREGKPIRIAPRHPEILLVPGSHFGDETEWLFGAADHLGDGDAVTVVINGGTLAMEEARLRLADGKRVVTVEGSGRAADELAADDDLRASGRLRVIPLTADAAAFAVALREDEER